MKELNDIEWKEFQDLVKEASIGEQLIGVNIFTATATIDFEKRVKK